MGHIVRYEIMGPLRVVEGERKLTIRARKIEVLLTVLLVRADQVVPIDQLIAEIWGEYPPRRAIAGLHVYVSQIRKFLRRPNQSESPVLTRPRDMSCGWVPIASTSTASNDWCARDGIISGSGATSRPRPLSKAHSISGAIRCWMMYAMGRSSKAFRPG
ncbi:hypothetical protein SSPO_014050 [Streptomyces antimycoticus]|uniref:OmpR/PhoB-type domain-containing protein n=1 Tax=Streptomyces antimycoticus TaxID=68175 RepID=A0A499UXP1_9ACTN|nr:hypothetical protein SSPO_014050 [Streptomyces antimycoticus]